MRIGLVGLQGSGKTTIFNALTGQQAQTSAFGAGRGGVNQAVTKVPDDRLDRLSALFNPKKHTPATVEFIDLAGVARGEGGAGDGLGDKQIAEIATAEALLVVIRGFADAAGQPPDVTGDLEAINLEMALSDLKKVENRLERMGKSLRGAAGREKELLEIEQAACVAVKGALEEGRPARAAALTPEQAKTLRGFQLLTMKPTMFLINEDEAGWAARKDSPVDLGPASAWPDTHGARLCGEMEMEIARLEEADRAAFMEDLGIREPAAHRVIRLCYELLGQISFFTVGPDECRAWTVRRGALAPEAAGAIHSDLERGFIRAEVIGWEELLALGSYAEAKKKGKLRLEGKQYEVRDGDVINVLFNV